MLKVIVLIATSAFVHAADKPVKLPFTVMGADLASRKISVEENKSDSKWLKRFKDLVKICLEQDANVEKLDSGSVEVVLTNGKVTGITQFSEMPMAAQECIKKGIEKKP